MKLSLLSCIVGVLPYLVQSSPQITQNCAGSHCGQNNVGCPAGPIAQNCQGSACQQNNVGRRKREIVAEILAEAVEAVERQERSAPPAGHGHDGGHQVHLPHVPDVHAPSPQHQQSQHHEQPSQHHEQPHQQESAYHKRSADPQQISQNCAGSQCNQNNLAAAAGLGGGFTGFFPSIAQNCVGSACNQNNVLGRRKREVLTHLIEEARKIAEEEVEAEEADARKKREAQISQNCVGSLCNQNNIASGGLHGLGGGFTGFTGGISQNCVGSACNQNNVLGRKKREIIAAILNEAN